MNPEDAIDMGREALRACMMIGGPILAVGLIVGLAVGVLQAMTQIQDQTVSFVPKILVMMVAIGISLPWLSQRMVDFSRQSFENPSTFLTDQVPVFTPSNRGFRNWEPPREDLEQSVDEVAIETPSTSMPVLRTDISIPTMVNPEFDSMPMLGSQDFMKSADSRVADAAADGSAEIRSEERNR